MKYQILDIPKTDHLRNSHLIGKIGTGTPGIIVGEIGSYSGTLKVPFLTNITVYNSDKASNRISKRVDKQVLSDQYLFFSNVKLKKIGN